MTPIDDLVGNRILVLANLLTRSAERRYERTLGLAQVEWRIVALLGAHPPMTLNEVAQRAGRDKSQISRGVSRLVRRRLVSRRPSPRDTRAVEIALTPRGRRAYGVLRASAGQRHRSLLAGFPARERRLLLAMLDRLTERARRLL